MDQEADLLLERNDGKRKTDLESGALYYDGTGMKKPESEEWKAWATIKRVSLPTLNVFTFFFASTCVLQISYSTDLTKQLYGSFLMPYALICYAFGTCLGVVLKFTEGKLLSHYFPKRYSHKKMTVQEFRGIGQAGFWDQWLVIFCMCLYVELTANIVGKIIGLNEVIVEEYPGVRAFTRSMFAVEPATVLVLLLSSVMALPMWDRTTFDLAWFGLSPYFIANSFPWGFPMYRVLVGMSSIHAKLVEVQKEYLAAKSAAQTHLDS